MIKQKQKHLNSNIALEIYRLAAKDQICPRNFLQMADADIIVSLHLVIPFISMIKNMSNL
jgi:hypothetical protein